MANGTIRVENQPGVVTSTLGDILGSKSRLPADTRFSILVIKPWQPTPANVLGPPLGILTLVAGLRRFFGDRVIIHFWDTPLHRQPPEHLDTLLAEHQPDMVALSALNLEAAVSYDLIRRVKAFDPSILTLLGGPFTLRQAGLVMRESLVDWVFEGAADRTLLIALERHLSGKPLGTDLPGFSYRSGPDSAHIGSGQDLITDLDSLPLPAWDLIDFERYRRRDRTRMLTNVAERRYASLFTSRGCPYLCNYCHDIFTKRFVYRSEENVLAEMERLYHTYGVREFHFVDDIFNLHKPRVRSLMNQIAERFPDVYLGFPNGLRGDILDDETIDAMVRAGTFHALISVETVTPRLQSMVEKHLDVEKAMRAVRRFADHGVIVQGAFMLGFPTETPEEIERTISEAIHSPLTQVHFFAVIPQPQTPIYEQALAEAPDATAAKAYNERHMMYGSDRSWYFRAYGYDLENVISRAYLRFYLHPPRLARIVRVFGWDVLWPAGRTAVRRALRAIAARISRRLVSRGRAPLRRRTD